MVLEHHKLALARHSLVLGNRKQVLEHRKLVLRSHNLGQVHIRTMLHFGIEVCQRAS